MQALHSQLLKDPSSVQVVTKTFISLPTADAHKGHQSGPGMACYTRRVHPTVVNKIGEIVAEGITDVQTVKRMLRHYVLHDLCKDQPPNPEDRAYFPFEHDIQNHVQIAKRALQLSCLDQENVQLKIEQWKSLYPDDTHFFRPYIQKEASESIAASSDVTPIEREGNQGSFIGNDGAGDAYSSSGIPNNCEQSLLWVHQTQWQQQLLNRYGNEICLLDATYKTTRYELPLFFVCVRTNCGYSVIAEFIVQSEDSEHIREAINILKSWNPKWNPKTFMTDYSEAESIALQSAFPGVNIYLCDFHREQAWERWVRDHKHGLTHEEGEVLLSLLRACAWAPSSSGVDTDSLYLQAVKNLKESNIWKTHMTVQQWLTTKWLSIPEVLVKITKFQLII